MMMFDLSSISRIIFFLELLHFGHVSLPSPVWTNKFPNGFGGAAFGVGDGVGTTGVVGAPSSK
jgi:hypothetical protein